MDVVAGAVARQYPDTNAYLATIYVRPALDAIVASAWQPMAMLWGAVGLVLVIACANVANMLLARTTDREREFGMRLAIGGSRGRVIQQFLAENLLLAATGSGAGVLMAIATLRFVVVPFAAGHVPRIEAVGLDPRLLAFAVLLAVCTALACSVPPALRIWSSGLRRPPRRPVVAKQQRRHDRGRGLLVVAQIAVGLVLVSSAGVLVAGFIRLLNRDLGFEPRQLLTFQTGLPSGKYSEEGRIAFTEQLLERLRRNLASPRLPPRCRCRSRAPRCGSRSISRTSPARRRGGRARAWRSSRRATSRRWGRRSSRAVTSR